MYGFQDDGLERTWLLRFSQTGIGGDRLSGGAPADAAGVKEALDGPSCGGNAGESDGRPHRRLAGQRLGCIAVLATTRSVFLGIGRQ